MWLCIDEPALSNDHALYDPGPRRPMMPRLRPGEIHDSPPRGLRRNAPVVSITTLDTGSQSCGCQPLTLSADFCVNGRAY